MMDSIKALIVRGVFFPAGEEDSDDVLCTVEEAGTEDMLIRIDRQGGSTDAIVLPVDDWKALLAFVAEVEREAE